MRGCKEAPGVLEIAHQVDCAVAGSGDAEVHGDVAVLVADRLDRCDLHAGGQHGFQGFHGQGPGESFLVEELVEGLRLVEQLGVVGLAHQGLGILALGANAGDLAVERVLAGAAPLQLDGRRGANRVRRGRESTASTAMAMRSRLSTGRRSVKGRVARLSVIRIRLARSRQRACNAGKTGLRQRLSSLRFGVRRPFHYGQFRRRRFR